MGGWRRPRDCRVDREGAADVAVANAIAPSARVDVNQCLVQAGVVRRFLAGLAVLAAAVVVPVSGSQGASETQVNSIRLGPLTDGHQQTGTVLLKAGVRYHLVVTGYVTQAGRDSSLGSYADDAFYHFEDSQHPGPPSPPGILFLGIRSEATGHVDFLRTSAEDRRDPPPYDPGHRYENHFTLKQDARLVVSANGLGDPNFTYGGPGFVVSVLSGGGSTPPPPPGPGPSRGGGCTLVSAALAHTASSMALFCEGGPWVQAFGFYGLGPGRTAIGVTPPLGDKLAKVKTTVSGVTDKDIVTIGRAVVAARQHPGLLQWSCLMAAKSDFKTLLKQKANRATIDTHLQRTILNALTCLAFGDELDAYIASHPEAAAAQAPVCALTGFGVTVQSRRGRPAQARVTTGAPNGPLEVTCVRSQGQIELTVKSRNAAVPLSRFLGPQLAIGIVRSRRDPPGGQVTVRFDRP